MKITVVSRVLLGLALVALPLAGCTSQAEDQQTLAGKIAQASFQAPVIGVRVLQDGAVVSSAPIAADGSFEIEVPPGTNYQVEVVTRDGAHALSDANTNKPKRINFKVCVAGNRYDMGELRRWGVRNSGGPGGGDGGDPTDPNDPGEPTDPPTTCEDPANPDGTCDPGDPGDPTDPPTPCDDPNTPPGVCDPTDPPPPCKDPANPDGTCDPGDPPTPCEDPANPDGNCDPGDPTDPPPPCKDPANPDGTCDPGDPTDPPTPCDDPANPDGNCDPGDPGDPTDPNCPEPNPDGTCGCDDPNVPGDPDPGDPSCPDGTAGPDGTCDVCLTDPNACWPDDPECPYSDPSCWADPSEECNGTPAGDPGNGTDPVNWECFEETTVSENLLPNFGCEE